MKPFLVRYVAPVVIKKVLSAGFNVAGT